MTDDEDFDHAHVPEYYIFPYRGRPVPDETLSRWLVRLDGINTRP